MVPDECRLSVCLFAQGGCIMSTLSTGVMGSEWAWAMDGAIDRDTSSAASRDSEIEKLDWVVGSICTWLNV